MSGLKASTVTVSVDTVSLLRGQVVSVFLHEKDRTVQVELHVNFEGKAQVVMNAKDHDLLRTFADVYGPEAEPTGSDPR